MLRPALVVPILGTCLVPIAAQSPTLRVDAAAASIPAGAVINYSVTGNPGLPAAVLLDVGGGPLDLVGQRVWLDLGGGLVAFDQRSLPNSGMFGGALSVPPLVVGIPFFVQAATASPARGLAVSGGESFAVHAAPRAIVERFDDPLADGITGTYDGSVLGRLAGGDLVIREHRTIDPQGVVFPIPLSAPLNHYGSRLQMVFRARDLGATGAAEALVGVAWNPGNNTVFADRYGDIELTVGPTDVSPDYTVDPWSALPSFPNSGLNDTFAVNYRTGAPRAQLFRGPYDIRPIDRRTDGFMPYPVANQGYVYNGSDNLLVEVFTNPSAIPGNGLNGQAIRIMVQSSPQPNARAYASGTAAMPLTPRPVVTGRGDNSLYDYVFTFARVRTAALSPFRAARPNADYDQPIVARSHGVGGLNLEFRGASDALGTNATPWSTDVNVADGSAFLQWRATFFADLRSGEAPTIDTLVVPYR